MDKKFLIIMVVSCAVVGVGYYVYVLPSKTRSAPIAMPPPVANPALPKAPAAPPVNLEQSDDAVRERAKSLSSDPKLAQWLNNDNIIRRIVAAAAIISDGNGPKDSLGFLSPGRHFSVMKMKGKIYLNPKSYERYDSIGGVFQSVDAGSAAKIFKDFQPLFQKAYAELGRSGGDAQDALIRSINVLLETPVVVGNIQLRHKVISWAMVDEKLEKLNAAQKHLLRMGPENTTKIQNKLREIALALGIPDGQLAKPETYASSVE